MSNAPSFIWESAAASIIRSVCGVAGACSDTMSERRRSSSSSTWRTPGASRWGLGLRLANSTSMSNARAMRATVWPMLPMPTIPSVFPATSMSGMA